MDRLWARGEPATVREVLADLRGDRELAYNTVLTVMDNLVKKVWVRRERDGRAHRSARVGLAAWYAVPVSVVGSVAGAAASLAVSWPATRDMVCSWWARCVEGLRGGHGTVGLLLGWTALAVAVVVLVRAAVAGW